MVEVRIELDEDMTRDDPPKELLPEPEPTLMIMAPPPPFLPVPAEPTISWDRWKNSFEQYLEALGEADLTDSCKCGLLRHCLGHEGQRVYDERVQVGATYAAAIFALTTHFKSRHDSKTCLPEFQRREQGASESVEDFVSALQDMLRPCTFESLKDELVLQQLIKKTSCKQLRERLMSEEKTLTLANALKIAKQMEYSLAESALACFQIVTLDSLDNEETGDDTVQLSARRSARLYEKSQNIKPHIGPRSSDSNKEDVTDKQSCSGNETETDEYYEFETAGNHKCYVGTRRNGVGTDEAEDETNGVSKVHNGTETEEAIVCKAKKKGVVCPLCERRFLNSNKLNRHMRMHTHEKPFRCFVCNMTFSQSYHMTRHIRNKHGANKHVCFKCGKDFSSSTELQSHRNTHAEGVLLHPDHKRFRDQSSLSNQIEPHTDDFCKQATYHKPGDFDGLMKLDLYKTYTIPTENCYGGDGSEAVIEHVNSDVSSTTVDVIWDEVEHHDGGSSEDFLPSTKTKGNHCPICPNTSFKNASKLTRHMRTHTKDKPFTCYVCKMTFSQSYHMTRHLRNQHGADKHVCYKCGKDFSSLTELKSHMETHVQEILSCPESDQLHPQGLVCSDCGKIFTSPSHLESHIIIHSKSTEKDCHECPDLPETCTLTTDAEYHLEIHQTEKNGTCDQTFSPEAPETQLDSLESSNVCTKCSKKFVNDSALKKHKEQFLCSKCDEHFCKKSLYKRHLQTHVEVGPHQCPCCAEHFSQKEDLEFHCLKHKRFRKEKPYSCTRCDHAFASLGELTAHMMSHSGEQPVNCPHCHKIFLNRNKLRRHMSMHTGERPHLCPTCGYGFHSAAGLKSHMYTHTGERPFKCSLCSKCYRTSSGLWLHIRRHTGVQSRYPCLDCGRTYGRMAELKSHQRYHTGDRPHSCTGCNKRFISKHKLNVHLRIHTGERPYHCPQCGQAFKQTGDRNRHMSKCH